MPKAPLPDPAALPDTLVPDRSVELPLQLVETSGLIFWDGLLWTHNDSDDPTLYGVDPADGEIVRELSLPGVSNRDWEDIAQDEHHVYIGDFGNNWGDRDDQNILMISKASIKAGAPEIEQIYFSFGDQEDYSTRPYRHDFDCEAMIVLDGQILLFTKEWLSAGTSIYTLPAEPGIQVARKLARWTVAGLVTGADLDPSGTILALSGYTALMQPFVVLAWDIPLDSLFIGDHDPGSYLRQAKFRKLHLSLFAHQVEGVAFPDSQTLYFSNEGRDQGTSRAVPQQIHSISLSGQSHP